MAWSLVNSTAFSGPVSTVSAGSALQGGWIEVSGGVNKILASGLLAQSSAVSSPWLNGRLMRPMAEASLEHRMVERFVAANGTSESTHFTFLRGDHGTSGFTGYLIGLSSFNDTFTFFTCVNGTVANYTAFGTLSGISAGTEYYLDINVIQTNSTTTTLTATVRNLSDTVLGSDSIADTTAALQNITGVPGVCINANGFDSTDVGRIRSIDTYTQVANSTSYTVSGPTGGLPSVASTNFTLTPNGSGPVSNVIVTPSDSGNGGTFNPTTVTFLASDPASKTFTYTNAVLGVKTLSFTNDGSLSNPGNITYTVANLTTLAANSPYIKFSPTNWTGDSGRGGSVYRHTWRVGSWFEVKFTASAAPTMTLMISTSTTTAQLGIYVNGKLTTDVAATGNVSVTNLKPSVVNTVTVYVIKSNADIRWNNGGDSFTINSIQLDSASTPITPTTLPYGIIVGDSVTEAEKAAPAGGRDIKYGYAFHLLTGLKQIGYDVVIDGCSRVGWIQTGDTTDDIPAHYYVSGGVYNASLSKWDKIDQGVSVKDSNGKISAYGELNTEPAFILINLLRNDIIMSSTVSDVQASIYQYLIALRASVNNTMIFLLVPPGVYDTSVALYEQSGPYITALKNAYDAYIAAYPNDTLTKLIDFGLDDSLTMNSTNYTYDGAHPGYLGHSYKASKLIPIITKELNNLSPRWNILL